MGMLLTRCSRCGKSKTPGQSFYIVRLTLTCDFDGELREMSEEQLASELKKQLKRAKRMSEKELMDEVFQEMSLYLCKGCRDWLVRQSASLSLQGADNG